MIRNMVTSALAAGLAAWLLAALLHFAFLQKYILLAEDYESGAAVHFAGLAKTAVPEPAAASEAATGAATGAETPGSMVMAGEDQTDEPAPSPLARNFWTAVFYGLVYVAYASLLVAGFGLARVYGREITAREGLLWGIAGFAALQLAPAMGLAPNLPGTPGAALADRQIWWWGTVLATATGLGLLAYGRGLASVAVAALLLGAPHVIGAPETESYGGLAPPEMAGAFASRVLGASFAAWALMGWIAGAVWARAWAGEADKPA
jgi:cobalt transporter subunit CbtA